MKERGIDAMRTDLEATRANSDALKGDGRDTNKDNGVHDADAYRRRICGGISRLGVIGIVTRTLLRDTLVCRATAAVLRTATSRHDAGILDCLRRTAHCREPR